MKNKLILSTFALAITFTACKKKETTPEPETPATTNGPSYTIPTSYTFTNANFTSSTQRIAMLGEITSYIRSTHTTTAATQPTLSAQKLKDMYANAAAQFTDATLNSSGLQLKDKTGNAFSFPTELEGYFDDCQPASITAAANPTVSTASSGVKGKLISPARAVLVNGNGFEYKELAEKGLMGTVFYYQAMTIMANISNYDNSVITNSSTAQERAWDEAFGYFGVPTSFPTSTVGLKYWGSYGNSVNVAINCNSTIMNAFLKGRAAISNKDNAARDEAKNVIVSTWEKISAAKCISYLKGAKNNLTDQATLHHNLSEGYGFVVAFKYNSAKTISDADINTLLGYFGTNLFNLSPANLDLAISKLESVFGLNATLIP
ncbi:MAG: DUF4856 domain-containing protein [Bacteroidota bacterium]|nr:DUF4856 domain-containing protein [Bacteroidota bacterium]